MGLKRFLGLQGISLKDSGMRTVSGCKVKGLQRKVQGTTS